MRCLPLSLKTWAYEPHVVRRWGEKLAILGVLVLCGTLLLNVIFY